MYTLAGNTSKTNSDKAWRIILNIAAAITVLLGVLHYFGWAAVDQRLVTLAALTSLAWVCLDAAKYVESESEND